MKRNVYFVSLRAVSNANTKEEWGTCVVEMPCIPPGFNADEIAREVIDRAVSAMNIQKDARYKVGDLTECRVDLLHSEDAAATATERPAALHTSTRIAGSLNMKCFTGFNFSEIPAQSISIGYTDTANIFYTKATFQLSVTDNAAYPDLEAGKSYRVIITEEP